MIKQASSVFYDQQANNYYKINKITGKVDRSFKTGKIPAKFNPDVTGKNYIKRKLHHKTQSHKILSEYKTEQTSSIKACQKKSIINPIRLNHIIQQHRGSEMKSSLSPSTAGYYYSRSNRQSEESSLNDSRSLQKKNYFRFSSKEERTSQNEKTLFQKSQRLASQRGSSLDAYQEDFSKSRLKQQKLNDTIQKYIRFQVLKTSQNNKHSNYQSGTLPILNVQAQMTRKSGFDILPAKFSMKKESLNKLKASQIRASLTQDPIQNAKTVQKQLSKQKKIFYQFHPQLLFKQNQRLINQQIDRKINFKKLQKLALAQNNKVCGQIYKRGLDD